MRCAAARARRGGMPARRRPPSPTHRPPSPAHRGPAVTNTGWPDNATDLQHPNLARIHDYLLGGAHNTAPDRDVARTLLAAVPDLRLVVQAQRALLFRAVCWCLDAGVGQFVDLGCGMPSLGGVRDVTARYAGGARVLCVDLDPFVVA